jgi:hypothetical protein
MHYYIDGYNLIFRVLKAKDSLRDRRTTLITELSNKIELLKLHTTLVFDSQYQSTEATRHHHKNLEIYYTDEGETADDYIIKSLKAIKQSPNKRNVTVVTSDLHLAWRARRENALTMSIDEYLDWINRRHRNKAAQIREELEAPPPPEKIELPKLIPEPFQKTKKKTTPIRKSDFDYYLEQFGGESDVKSDVGEGPTLKKLEEPPKEKYETDFERWLREFGG